MDKVHRDLFRHGSRTYYFSSIFFPSALRAQIFILYGFVRKADNFVDQIPQDGPGFLAFKRAYEQAWQGQPSGDPVIDDFVILARTHHFDPAWIQDFLSAMEADLIKRDYHTIEEVQQYMVGSAEVIGLFMCRLMGLPEDAYASARLQGRAMQYINFIRDIAEDLMLGRTYLPRESLHEAGLTSLHGSEVRRYPDRFGKLINAEIDRYIGWQVEAERGYAYLPQRYRLPVRTAADMYRWTAEVIRKDPTIVFRKKVKPSVVRILGRGLRNVVKQT